MMHLFRAAVVGFCATSLHALNDEVGLVQKGELLLEESGKPTLASTKAKVLKAAPAHAKAKPAPIMSAKTKAQMQTDAAMRGENKAQRLAEKQAELKAQAERAAQIKAKMDHDGAVALQRRATRVAESKAARHEADQAAAQQSKLQEEMIQKARAKAELRKRVHVQRVRAGRANTSSLTAEEIMTLAKSRKHEREVARRKREGAFRAAMHLKDVRYQRKQEAKAEKETELRHEHEHELHQKEVAAHKDEQAKLYRASASRAHMKPTEATPAEDKAPAGASRLRFVDNLGRGVQVIVPSGTRMGVPLSVASSRFGEDQSSLRFSREGHPIRPSETMEAHGLSDLDTIDVDGVTEE